MKKIEDTSARKVVEEKIAEEKEIEKEARKEALKMGDSPRHSEEDWSWDECDQEWEGTAEKETPRREKRLKDKEERQILRRRLLQRLNTSLALGRFAENRSVTSLMRLQTGN